MGIKNSFNKSKREAGKDWFQSFLRRHPDLSIRKSEGLSLARAEGMNRIEVKAFFDLLLRVLDDNKLHGCPDRIWNMDESGIQLINKPNKVVASKGSKVVHTVTPCERGKNITVVACANAEGHFLPPACVLKGVNRRPRLEEDLPPGSKVYLNRKSSFITSDIFNDWVKTLFLPRKPQGKVLLILDGHSSHMSDVEMLQFLDNNDIILLCLPSHTTQALQPLDRCFFKPLKTAFQAVADAWMHSNPSRKITRDHFGRLLSMKKGSCHTACHTACHKACHKALVTRLGSRCHTSDRRVMFQSDVNTSF
ncbi:tigger transposable element-derived protein 6-like [Ornithodoros turicata]|uniref:tigger transposable element-derived protein 6-like n=1 Tax=Ornithodoros turicata TaxID=34597 RepID=UPI00313910DB